MNSRILFALLALLATSFAVDITFTPVAGFSADDMIATPMTVGLTNGAGSTLSSVTFTLGINASGVTYSYGPGNTKVTVGTITNGATGSGAFTIIGPQGAYAITFYVIYKKGFPAQTYTTNYTLPLTIFEGGGVGKRAVAEIDLAEIEAADAVVAKGSDDDDDDDSNVPINANASPKVLVVPVAVDISALEAAWVPLGVKNIVSKKIRSVSYSVSTSNPNIVVNYRGSCAPLNGLGEIKAAQWGNASYQIGGPAGSYTLTVRVQYILDNQLYYQTQSVNLQIINGPIARSAAIAFVSNEDGSMKTEYVIGFGVGIACFAGLAVVGAAIMYRKRNAALTIA